MSDLFLPLFVRASPEPGIHCKLTVWISGRVSLQRKATSFPFTEFLLYRGGGMKTGPQLGLELLMRSWTSFGRNRHDSTCPLPLHDVMWSNSYALMTWGSLINVEGPPLPHILAPHITAPTPHTTAPPSLTKRLPHMPIYGHDATSLTLIEGLGLCDLTMTRALPSLYKRPGVGPCHSPQIPPAHRLAELIQERRYPTHRHPGRVHSTMARYPMLPHP